MAEVERAGCKRDCALAIGRLLEWKTPDSPRAIWLKTRSGPLVPKRWVERFDQMMRDYDPRHFPLNALLPVVQAIEWFGGDSRVVNGLIFEAQDEARRDTALGVNPLRRVLKLGGSAR